MEVGNGLEAVLAPGVLVDVAHGAGSVERHRRHDVRELVRLHVAQDLAHATTLQLENAGRLTRGEQLVEARIVERDVIGINDVASAFLHVVDGALDQRQRGQTQDIHLEQADLVEDGKLVLRGLALFAFLTDAHEGRHVGQRLTRDDDAGRVGGVVALDILKLLCRVDQALHVLRVLVHLTQLRHGEGALQI